MRCTASVCSRIFSPPEQLYGKGSEISRRFLPDISGGRARRRKMTPAPADAAPTLSMRLRHRRCGSDTVGGLPVILYKMNENARCEGLHSPCRRYSPARCGKYRKPCAIFHRLHCKTGGAPCPGYTASFLPAKLHVRITFEIHL